jgi:hypothetical protein
MTKRPYQTTDPIRRTQPGSGQPIGWLPTLKEQVANLRRQLEGVELRLDRRLEKGEPAATVGERVFQPQPTSFNFDYLQNGASSVDAQFVVQDGITYEIPIVFPPPGVFRARYLKVNIYQRVSTPAGPFQFPVTYGNFFSVFGSSPEYQTLKFLFPNNAGGTFNLQQQYVSRRLSFLWNLIDMKSGTSFSDEMLPDLLLLPQSPTAGPPIGSYIFATNRSALPWNTDGTTGGNFEFATPWLFERDAQLTFLFRPITPALQPTATSGYFPFNYDDREMNGVVRNMAITVRAELHGTRYVDAQDALRLGARIPAEGNDL